MRSPAFEQNVILFGQDPTEGIVAVERLDDNAVRLFMREEGRLIEQDEPLTPFILLEDNTMLGGFKGEYRIDPLSGSNEYKALAIFGNWGDCLNARSYLQKTTGASSSSPEAPYLFLSDPVHQHLLFTGQTLFKGLSYEDIHRLAIDIETSCAPGYEFSNPLRDEDRILSIALMDNGGYSEVLFGTELGEKEMIALLSERIRRLDPDVLEGHNVFNFDLEYIVARSKKHGVRLEWGRDGSVPRIRRSRFNVAERSIDYTRMEVFGRHVVDTMFLLQYYDVAARELESYGLKSAARHFGLAEAERVYIDGDMIRWYFENDPETLKRYNLADVRETMALSELLGYPFFLQAQIFPFSFQNIFVRGNATKINALFLREYLRQRASIPKPKGRTAVEGGYTDVFMEGVVKDVVHCDVASLYPSIMLAFQLRPRGDHLEVFLPLLADLREFRLEAKKNANDAKTRREREYYSALQQTFKILINSFYGYLGTEIHHFSEPAVAAEVTSRGRGLIREMIDWLRSEGASPVEIDTDGIYFVPAFGEGGEKNPEELVSRLSATLPEGIDVELDGQFKAMFSYKRKNYALLDESGKVIIKGSALRSRGMEKYLREFLSSMLRHLLEGRGGHVHKLYQEASDKLESHGIDISWLAKTETLTESPDTYRQKVQAKKRNAAATYELALGSGRDYRAGDQISFYVTGAKKNLRVYENCKFLSEYDEQQPDENVAYYKAKLSDVMKKFEGFLPHDDVSDR